MVLNTLTNEEIAKIFGDRYNHFTLADFVIKIAQLLIKRGEEVTPWILLEEIRKNPERYDLEDLKKEKEEPSGEERP